MQEQIDGRVIDVMRKLQREAQDDEYESSTPAAGRWRERVAPPRRDQAAAGTSRPVSDDRGADDDTKRLAQRHRFGRALDLPPWEPRDDLGEARALLWLAAGAVALWTLAAVLIWFAR